MAAAKSETITVRLSPEVREKMETVRNAMPYKPTVTVIIERGIELALAEIEHMTGISADHLKNIRDNGA